jgi:GDP-4-dehydro-6-deoxy-D-mannose reductase
MPMRVLITGAGGFVGRHLIAALAALADAPEIVAGTYGEEASSLLDVRAVSLDVTDAEQTLAVIQAEQPTHVMHLAGISVISQANREVRRTWEVNAQGTLNVALAIKAGAPACRLIFCSSAQVYGGSFRSGKPLAEDAPLDPENFYAASKAAADILVGQMAKAGLRAVRLRPFNHTGPGQPPTLAVASFASQIAAIERAERKPVMKVGNLSMRREFLDVRDVVDAYLRTIQRFDSLPNGTVLNISSGEAIEVDAVLKMLLAMSAKKIEVATDPALLRPNDTPIMVGNAEAAHRALGWTPRQRVADTLKSVLDYYRQLRG